MERLLDNFTEIFNKEIKLHKKIKDDEPNTYLMRLKN